MYSVAKSETGQTFAAPVRAGAVFDGEPAAIAEARRFTADFVAVHGSTHSFFHDRAAMGAAQLVVSELVTNVVKYAPGPCLVDLTLDATALEISVWDSGRALPVTPAADPARVGRHGLEIVTALCSSYTVRPEAVGKRTVVRIDAHSAA